MQEQYLDQAIDWVKKRGFSNIKAVHEDFESPAGFTKPGDDQPYIPNITGLRTGGKCYIEVAVKTDDIQRSISKWKLLSTLAARKGGKLYLLAPRGHKTFAESVVKGYNLNAEIKSI